MEKLKQIVLKLLDKYAIVAVLLFMILVMGIFIPGFLNVSNMLIVLVQSSIYALLGMGMTFVIISGGIDLAAGSITAMAAVFCGLLGQTAAAQQKFLPWLPQMPIIIPIIAALIVGALCGLANGLLISKGGLFPFIATLGTFTLVRGLALSITKGKPITRLIGGFRTIGGNLFGFFPTPILILIIMAVICTIILNHTRFGSNIFAIGGNRNAAKITGVNIPLVLIGVYVLAGILYGVGAFLYAGRTLTINPGVADGYELKAVTASVIGGTSLVGGKGAIWGAIIGALILAVIQNGLTMLAIDAYWQQVIEGLIIIIAVIIVVKRKTK